MTRLIHGDITHCAKFIYTDAWPQVDGGYVLAFLY